MLIFFEKISKLDSQKSLLQKEFCEKIEKLKNRNLENQKNVEKLITDEISKTKDSIDSNIEILKKQIDECQHETQNTQTVVSDFYLFECCFS